MAGSQRRFDLKSRTQTAHERLDAAVGGFSTLEEYKLYVVRLGHFRAAMDGALQNVAWPSRWSWRPTCVTRPLNEDAIDLGLPTAAKSRSDMDLTDRSALLGALYVLEGSTLGSRVLQQRATTLGLSDAFGARHLAVMSKDVLGWRSFLTLLDGTSDFDIYRAADSANAVFAFALQCFETHISTEPEPRSSGCVPSDTGWPDTKAS